MDYIELDTDTQQIITSEQAWHYNIVPRGHHNGVLKLYANEHHFDEVLLNELELLFNKQIDVNYIDSYVIQKTLSKYYRRSNTVLKNNTKYISSYDVTDFLDNLISEAQGIGCSDIHAEPYEEYSRIRMRIDGKLIERYKVNKSEYPALVNKVKIKASLDISEKRLPQDGRIIFKNENTEFDIRVSILPTIHGEKIVLRLLNKNSTNIDINYLGFSEKQLKGYLQGIKRSQGIVLISGPTGSGKTTTLYATLKILNEEKTNILTIEDPVEYTLEGINQVQLKDNIGLTFTKALRTFLRQDPDIIMLGEIRDVETAQMAIRASLTGHLVLSTIHTNSAWGTVTRLIDMGIPPFLLASTLSLSIAQRLVRVLCPNCKKEVTLHQEMLPIGYRIPEKVETIYTAIGCENCYYTGYKGRKAVYEVIPITSTLGDEIKNNNLVVDQILSENKIMSLSDNAFYLMKEGLTSVDEIYPLLIG